MVTGLKLQSPTGPGGAKKKKMKITIIKLLKIKKKPNSEIRREEGWKGW